EAVLGIIESDGKSHQTADPSHVPPLAEDNCTWSNPIRLSAPIDVRGTVSQWRDASTPNLRLGLEGPGPAEMNGVMRGHNNTSCTLGTSEADTSCKLVNHCLVTGDTNESVPWFIQIPDPGAITGRLAFRVPSGRFGSSFTVHRTWHRRHAITGNTPPLTGSKVWEVTLDYTLDFQACPRHGRDVADC